MKAELIYLAGFIEADGCFHITDTGIAIRITNKNPKVLKWFCDNFGGRVRSKSSPSNCFEWNVHGIDAEQLSKDLLPYLIFKGDEAKALIRFASTRNPRGKRLSEETKTLRLELREFMRQNREARNAM